jgi:hypothetical protein
MPLDNAPADRKTQSCAGVFVFVKALKKPKDSLGIFGIEANAVVSDRNRPRGCVTLGSDLHLWPRALGLVLDGV